MSENPNEHDEKTLKFRAQILDNDPEDRMVRIEPIFIEDSFLEHEGKKIPQLRGIGFHMHAKSTIVDENGAEEQWTCDYVALDVNQIIQLRSALDSLLYIREED